jgi:hypothetical protein
MLSCADLGWKGSAEVEYVGIAWSGQQLSINYDMLCCNVSTYIEKHRNALICPHMLTWASNCWYSIWCCGVRKCRQSKNCGTKNAGQCTGCTSHAPSSYLMKFGARDARIDLFLTRSLERAGIILKMLAYATLGEGLRNNRRKVCATRRRRFAKSSHRRSLEPGISGSGGRRLIH